MIKKKLLKKEFLSLNHRDLLQEKFKDLHSPLSEYSFASLYLFRQIHQYQVITIGDEIFIEGITRDKVPFFMPTSLSVSTFFPSLRSILTPLHIIYPIPDEWLSFYDPWFSYRHFKRDDSDYLFAADKLATYPGRHLDGKRNQITQLLSQGDVRCEALSNQWEDALSILTRWQAEDGNISSTDYTACKEAIEYFITLQLQGFIVYVDQKPAGFIIGEQCNSHFTIHFSKAIRTIHGVYPYLFQQFARAVKSRCDWLNLEQDLGIPNLRRSKLSYHPDQLATKWRLCL